ncbi:MAG: thiamine phosphate synthase [Candidatus Abyssubacteria bacterium]
MQFRGKRLSKGRYYEQARVLLSISKRYGIPFLVNDHLDIALAIKADGIHLGQNDLPFSAARQLVPSHMLLGVSTHSAAQAAEAMKRGVSYIAIGPVFPTTTKETPEPVVGLDTVRKVKTLTGNVPLIAIGGITGENVADTMRTGVDGVAVASAVVAAECPRESARLLKRKIIDI